jgi:hypothetical protein
VKRVITVALLAGMLLIPSPVHAHKVGKVKSHLEKVVVKPSRARGKIECKNPTQKIRDAKAKAVFKSTTGKTLDWHIFYVILNPGQKESSWFHFRAWGQGTGARVILHVHR